MVLLGVVEDEAWRKRQVVMEGYGDRDVLTRARRCHGWRGLWALREEPRRREGGARGREMGSA